MSEALLKLVPPAYREFAKAVAPFVGTIIAVVIQVIATGEFDRAELTTAITGLSAAVVAYLVPNRKARKVQ